MFHSKDYDHRLNILYANAATHYGEYRSDYVVIENAGTLPEGRIVILTTGTSVPYSCVKVSHYSPDNNTTLYIGTEAGRLFRVHNANAIPLTKEIGSEDFPTAYISCIDIGKSEAELLVTFFNYPVNNQGIKKLIIWLLVKDQLLSCHREFQLHIIYYIRSFLVKI